MKYIIFYSWQSDLPNNTNRGFIESVINSAIKDIKDKAEYEIYEPDIDRDTQGIPGSPNISQTIFDKIQTCDAFVADISIVTGNKCKGSRLSPNPNVLIELGYAIALLGWDKIILFCNELYGTNEDLPFDIRPHRRIGYSLKEKDGKSEEKKRLASIFKSNLVTLLQQGKSKFGIKEPIVSVEWNYVDYTEESSFENGIDSSVITLKRADDFSHVISEVENDIERANSIDGRIDPKWDEKLQTYLSETSIFLKEVRDKNNLERNLSCQNRGKIFPITLSIINEGNAIANNIRVEVEIPEWLFSYEEYPDKKNCLERPVIPIPELPNSNLALNITRDALFKLYNPSTLDPFHSLSLSPPIKRTSACYLNNRKIKLWADDLLHKHRITKIEDRFYLLASPDASIGVHTLQGQAFCAEYDDWKDIELLIKIK